DLDAQLLDLAGLEFVDRPGGDDLPRADDDDRVAEPLDEVELVAGEDDRGPGGGPVPQGGAHDVDGDRVETGERLVEDEHLGVVHERDGQLDALLVAQREVLDVVPYPLGEVELL